MQARARSSWLLLLCGIFEVVFCGMNFFMLQPDGSLAFRTFVSYRNTLVDMGILALGAGVCAIAAAIWNSRKIPAWLLALNGVALSVLGALLAFWTGPLSFRTIALLIAAMAISAGAYQLLSWRGRLKTGRLWTVTALISFGFAIIFLAFALHWINLRQISPVQIFILLGSYFGFSAICMFLLAAKTEPKALAAL